MSKYIYASGVDWLQQKINELQASNNTGELADMFRVLVTSARIDHDMVQDAFQSDMDADGFFYDLETGPIDEANVSKWNVGDCKWFLKYRLGVDLNKAPIKGDDPKEWQNYTTQAIEEYEDSIEECKVRGDHMNSFNDDGICDSCGHGDE